MIGEDRIYNQSRHTVSDKDLFDLKYLLFTYAHVSDFKKRKNEHLDTQIIRIRENNNSFCISSKIIPQKV